MTSSLSADIAVLQTAIKNRSELPCPLCGLPMRNYEADRNRLLYICKAHEGYPTLCIRISGIKTAKGVLPALRKQAAELSRADMTK